MTELNKWTKLGTKEVYDNAWIKVEHDDVLRPNGSKGIYGKVHFKNKAIGIIPLDKRMNTWLIGQFRYVLNEYSWEIPMGGGPIDSDILDSAKRELKEETGIMAQKWTKLLRIHTSNCVSDEEGFVFLAEDLSFGDTDFDETEDLQIKKIPFQEVIAMALDGRITDSISIIGILTMARKLGM